MMNGYVVEESSTAGSVLDDGTEKTDDRTWGVIGCFRVVQKGPSKILFARMPQAQDQVEEHRFPDKQRAKRRWIKIEQIVQGCDVVCDVRRKIDWFVVSVQPDPHIEPVQHRVCSLNQVGKGSTVKAWPIEAGLQKQMEDVETRGNRECLFLGLDVRPLRLHELTVLESGL